MSDELLPCPFCGSVPELRKRGEILLVFACPETSTCFGSGIATYGQNGRRREAIAAWNTRPTIEQSSMVATMDLRERVAAAMWKYEADKTTPNVGKHRTMAAFQTEMNDADRDKWLGFALAAILALTTHSAEVEL